MTNQERLSALLNDPVHPFIFPANRETDIRWLNRNLHINNKDNPNFEHVKKLIVNELRRLNGSTPLFPDVVDTSNHPSRSRDERLQHEGIQNIFDTGA